MQTQEINFYCRPSKVNKEGEAFIEMSIVINKERTYVKLQRKCRPEEFAQAMASKKSNPIKQYCDITRARINDLLADMVDNRVELTAQNLKDCYKRGGVISTYTLDDMFQGYLQMISKKVPNEMSQDTYNRYVKCTQFFYMFNEGMKKTTPARQVEYTNLVNVQSGLLKEMSNATSCNYLQKLKAIFTDAFNQGHIPSNPAFSLKIDKGKSDKILYLTRDEVNKIRNYTRFNDRLQKVADLFLFSCFTGLAYSDLAELTPEDFKTNNSGQIIIDRERHKTGVRFVAVLLNDSIDIAKKYNYKLPVISNQKYNAYLKEIGYLVGIEKSLTTHMARHTCCSYLLNYRPAIPNETIIRVMGWTNEKQLRHYARLLNETIFEDLSGITGKKTEEPVKKTPKFKKIY